MVLKLYGYPFSNCTRRVAVVLAEKEVPFQLISVDLIKGEQKTPEVLEKQPFGQIPYIVSRQALRLFLASSYLHHKDDDGFILFESRAICRYIATKYSSQGTPLVPTELKALARFEEAASIETANFDQYASGAAIEKILKPFVF